MHISILTKGKVKGIGGKGRFIVCGGHNLKTIADAGVGGTFQSRGILFVTKIDTRSLGHGLAQSQVSHGRTSTATAQVNVADGFGLAQQFQGRLEHVVRHGVTGLTIGTFLVQVNAVPFAKVNVGSTCVVIDG